MDLRNSADGCSDREYEALCRVFFERTGIRYGPEKRLLVENRLNRLRKPQGPFGSWADLVAALDRGADSALLDLVTSRLSTHYSYFFREPIHFRFVQDRLVGPWKDRSRVRILSAACAAGEEAWSLAMTAQGVYRAGHPGAPAEEPTPDVLIDGLDVAPASVDQARRAVYPDDEVVPHVPPGARQRYLGPEPDGQWSVAAWLRPLCRFDVENLLTTDHLAPGQYDLILLRNVLIYFDPGEKRRMLLQMHRLLKPGGYLILGLSETLGDLRLPFRPHPWSICSRA